MAPLNGIDEPATLADLKPGLAWPPHRSLATARFEHSPVFRCRRCVFENNVVYGSSGGGAIFSDEFRQLELQVRACVRARVLACVRACVSPLPLHFLLPLSLPLRFLLYAST